jgi:hypothetical protein
MKRNLSELPSYLRRIQLEFQISDSMEIRKVRGMLGQECGHQGGRHISQGSPINMVEAKGRLNDRSLPGLGSENEVSITATGSVPKQGKT